MISAKFVPLKYYIYTLIATAASNLVFSWVFGSANSVTRSDRRNAKMVYTMLYVISGKKRHFAHSYSKLHSFYFHVGFYYLEFILFYSTS